MTANTTVLPTRAVPLPELRPIWARPALNLTHEDFLRQLEQAENHIHNDSPVTPLAENSNSEVRSPTQRENLDFLE